MTTTENASTSPRSAGGRIGRAVLGVARSAKRTVAGRLNLSYPGQCETGEYFAEIYLTWFFGKGSVMWRQRFTTELDAVRAVKEHAQFLDNELPRSYRVEDWSGRPYWEKHEYGIAYGVGQSAGRAPEELTAISRTTLPGT